MPAPERMRGAAMTATGRAVAGLAAAVIVAGTALAAAPPAMSAARRAQAGAAAAGTPAPAPRAGMAGMALMARGRPAGPAGWRRGWCRRRRAACCRGRWASLIRATGRYGPGRAWTAYPAQHLAAVFAPGRVTVHAGALTIGMAVRGYGYTAWPGRPAPVGLPRGGGGERGPLPAGPAERVVRQRARRAGTGLHPHRPAPRPRPRPIVAAGPGR